MSYSSKIFIMISLFRNIFMSWPLIVIWKLSCIKQPQVGLRACLITYFISSVLYYKSCHFTIVPDCMFFIYRPTEVWISQHIQVLVQVHSISFKKCFQDFLLLLVESNSWMNKNYKFMIQFESNIALFHLYDWYYYWLHLRSIHRCRWNYVYIPL